MHLLNVPLLGALALLLSACQSPNPYVASGAPIPPTPAHVAEHIDRSAYPAPARDFAQYRNWRWQRLPSATTWASSAEIQLALSNALDQRGLRPQQSDAASDLQISVVLSQEQRLRQVYEDYSGYGYSRPYAWGHGYYGNGYSGWGGPRWGGVRSYAEQVLVVQLDFYDGHDGQLLWSSRSEVAATKQQRSQALQSALQQALADYPPDD
ncbi:DUF4136 domain-containing protein [Pseudomonas sp. 5P_3.1_Bac2]|uniref:DUF4136 domain-containing protein n=1 Tax=Pseudomonas sp. 5P_3.1_Bac2 TaxID=2971617 RepID=UPI0021C7C3AF|nr:DUF4136 domain-containing protein [Pseudomonas sp. 5P_3.1_Bac2]MCU1719377.1 DUF4136 domain-containing protein [Pseudomonas sp. 5P_3.1_Bac2]